MNTISRPIRVAMVIQEYHPIIGGAEQQLASQAALLKDMGVDIHGVTRRWSGLSPFEIIRGIPVHRMPSWGPRPVAALFFIFTAFFKLLWLKPDIIHAFELLSPSTIAVLVKWFLHRPLIIKVLRGGVLGDLKKIGDGSLGRLRVPFVVRAADAFVVISTEIDAELAALKVPSERRVFIPNGVDTYRFSPVSLMEKNALRARLGIPDGPLAVFTGRLEIEKRLDKLISVWPIVRSSYPNANLLLVGTGSQEQSLRLIAGDGVIFTGGVEDVSFFLKAADIFILPSVAEGLSNALLEGLSCELAVIATSIGGTTDVITHETNGLLITPDSPDELLVGLLRLFESAEFRHQLGMEGRKLILEKYSLHKAARSVRQLYELVMKNHGKN